MPNVVLTLVIAVSIGLLTWGAGNGFKGVFGKTKLIDGVRFSFVEFVIIAGVISGVIGFFGYQTMGELNELTDLLNRGKIDYDFYLYQWDAVHEDLVRDLLFFVMPILTQTILTAPIGSFYEEGVLLDTLRPYEAVEDYEIIDNKIKVYYYKDDKVKHIKFRYRNHDLDEIEALLREGMAIRKKRLTKGYSF